jgi:hypothetical protein
VGNDIAAQQAVCGSLQYCDEETIVTATLSTASSELHPTTSAKLALRNDQ